MSTWQPASQKRVQTIVERQLRGCTVSQRTLFDRIRIPTTAHPIERFGRIESVFAVARVGGSLLFWEDVEEGFELATPDDDGALRQYGASQFELSHIMHQVQNGQS